MIANFGVVNSMRTSAPEALSLAIWGRWWYRSPCMAPRPRSASCRRGRPSGPSDIPCPCHPPDRGRRSCCGDGSPADTAQKFGLRPCRSAGSPWSRETRAADPRPPRPTRQRGAAPFLNSGRAGSPRWCSVPMVPMARRTLSSSTSLRVISMAFFGIVAVVIGDHIDLAAVDTALGVDLVQIGRDDLGYDAIGGGRTGIWSGVADADFVGARGAAGPCPKAGPAIAARTSAVAALRRGATKNR